MITKRLEMRYFLILLFITVSLFADRSLQLKKMAEEQRLALVIGNNTYLSISNLKNPINDAKAMRDAIRSRGFEVIYLENATQKQFDKEVKKFTTRLKNNGGVGLFYYAGHGIAVEGNNYLIATDSDISDKDEVRYEAIALNEITDRMRHANNRVNIIILDACRNDPFSRSGGGGLAPLRNARGMFVAYATEAGAVAQDGSGKNGIFTEYLIKHIDEPVKIEEVFKRTRRDVATRSHYKQFPGVYNQLYGDFYFTLPGKKKIIKKSSYTFGAVAEEYSLTIETEPTNARVYITNIKPRYYDGITLVPGKYKIKVVQSGYHTKRGEVNLYSDLSLKIVLQKKKIDSPLKVQPIAVLSIPKKVATVPKEPDSSLRQVDADNIFLDSNTSLMWQDDHDVKINTKNWKDAKAYCSALSLEDYKDWRLPTIYELKSIVDTDQTPTINIGFNNIAYSTKAYYWSSNIDRLEDDRALYLYFYNGYAFDELKTEECYVRCVRRNFEEILYKKVSVLPKKKNQSPIVVDPITNLMWQDNNDVIRNARSWDEAKTYCSDLELENYMDWKLPTLDEFKSIVDTTRLPTINERFNNITTVSKSYYWSMNSNIYSVNYASYLYFKYGHSYDAPKTEKYYIRCVRGYSKMFLDKDTNLMWQDNYETIINAKSWSDAKAYCSDLSMEMYDDWRLPTIDELRSIVDKERNPTIKVGFNTTNGSFYWSSNSDDFDDSRAVYLYFSSGYSFDESKSEENYVRCVRGKKK